MLRCVSQMLRKWRIVMQLVICLLVKLVRFHIAVWSLSKSVRASSFIENFSQISTKLIAFQRNLLAKLLRNRPFFTNRFSVKLALKIPAKFPRNRPFFPRICPRKSREIWLFSRNLPEALTQLQIERSRCKPWLGTMHCVLGQNTLKFLTQCLSPPIGNAGGTLQWTSTPPKGE